MWASKISKLLLPKTKNVTKKSAYQIKLSTLRHLNSLICGNHSYLQIEQTQSPNYSSTKHYIITLHLTTHKRSNFLSHHFLSHQTRTLTYTQKKNKKLLTIFCFASINLTVADLLSKPSTWIKLSQNINTNVNVRISSYLMEEMSRACSSSESLFWNRLEPPGPEGRDPPPYRAVIAETLGERETEFGFTELGFEKRSPKSLDSSVENGVVLVRKGLKQKLLLLLLAIPAIASGTEFKWSCSYFLSAIFLRMVGHNGLWWPGLIGPYWLFTG